MRAGNGKGQAGFRAAPDRRMTPSAKILRLCIFTPLRCFICLSQFRNDVAGLTDERKVFRQVTEAETRQAALLLTQEFPRPP